MGSIRLESIRDGLEEYEMLAEMERAYKAAGLESDDILQKLLRKAVADAMVTAERRRIYAGEKEYVRGGGAVPKLRNVYFGYPSGRRQDDF